MTSPYRERMDEGLARAFPHVERVTEKRTRPLAMFEGLQPVAAHWGAGIVDGMVVAGMSVVLLVCILLITRVNLMGLLTNAQTDGPTQIHLALLFISVLQLYLLTARSFLGASLGEWAFELQLGTDEDHRRMIYPLQVAWRSMLMTITGFIVLPLISTLVGRDLAKFATGLQLYRRP